MNEELKSLVLLGKRGETRMSQVGSVWCSMCGGRAGSGVTHRPEKSSVQGAGTLCIICLLHLPHRTNSDSALHTSAMNPNPQDPFGMNQQMGRGPPQRNGEINANTHSNTLHFPHVCLLACCAITHACALNSASLWKPFQIWKMSIKLKKTFKDNPVAWKV